jgi:hypothetical protein
MQPESNGQLINNENPLNFQVLGQNTMQESGPKKYNQYYAKSADFNSIKIDMRPSQRSVGRRMSIDETNNQDPIISNKSAFVRKSISNISGNDNSYSANNPNMSVIEEENKFTKLMNDPTIDLEDYPVPPIPRMYRNSTRLFVPDQLERKIQSLMSKASEATCSGNYQEAK